MEQQEMCKVSSGN